MVSASRATWPPFHAGPHGARLTADYPSGMTINPPGVGDAAPDFPRLGARGPQVSLAGFLGRRVILYFYPAAMTPGCTTEACDFSAAKPQIDTAREHAIASSTAPPCQR